MKKYKNELITVKQAIVEILDGISKLSDFVVLNFEEYYLEDIEDYTIGSITNENTDEDIMVIKRTLLNEK